MATLRLTGMRRNGIGKGAARKLRREGLVPAVVYGGEEVAPLAVDRRELMNILAGGRAETSILGLVISGEGKQRQVMIKEVQLDPVRREPLHVDLYEVSMDRVIRVSVPITLVGEAVGVRRDGGILHHLSRELEIECLPGRIPEEVTVDISSLEMGHVMHVGDLQLGEGIRVLTHPEEPVASVARPVVEKVEVPEEVPEKAAAPTEEPQAEKRPAE